ncbi:hypothetical protein Q7P37_003363 [Cladosporium fusiforme]
MADENPDPVRKVFNTTELLEAISLHLPVETLARSRRVSKFWKEAIDDSGKLQRALFLKPEEADFSFEGMVRGLSYNFYVRGRQVSVLGPCSEFNHHYQYLGQVHPSLPSWFSVELRQPFRDKTFEGGHDYILVHLIANPLVCSLERAPPNALICQPPLQTLDVRHLWRDFTIEREEGVTFGAILEEVEKMKFCPRQEMEQRRMDRALNRRATIKSGVPHPDWSSVHLSANGWKVYVDEQN